jgi:hypothetical protein
VKRDAKRVAKRAMHRLRTASAPAVDLSSALYAALRGFGVIFTCVDAFKPRSVK